MIIQWHGNRLIFFNIVSTVSSGKRQIELFYSDHTHSNISVGIRAFVMGLSQISSFFLFTYVIYRLQEQDKSSDVE